MYNYFNDNLEDEYSDAIERNIKIWSATDLDKYLMTTFNGLPEEIIAEIELYLMDKYYSGSKNLSDDELIRQKNYSSLHVFQYTVSIKRLIENSGKGCVITYPDGWRFGFGMSL